MTNETFLLKLVPNNPYGSFHVEENGILHYGNSVDTSLHHYDLYLISGSRREPGSRYIATYNNNVIHYSPIFFPSIPIEDSMKMVMATTNKKLNTDEKIPRFSEKYIHKYIEMYNQGNVLETLTPELEYLSGWSEQLAQTYTSDSHLYTRLKLNDKNEIMEETDCGQQTEDSIPVSKVRKLLYDLFIDAIQPGEMFYETHGNLDNWIDKHLSK
jgi:hypothetical protein